MLSNILGWSVSSEFVEGLGSNNRESSGIENLAEDLGISLTSGGGCLSAFCGLLLVYLGLSCTLTKPLLLELLESVVSTSGMSSGTMRRPAVSCDGLGVGLYELFLP